MNWVVSQSVSAFVAVILLIAVLYMALIDATKHVMMQLAVLHMWLAVSTPDSGFDLCL
jgi:hypothetical protein